MNGGGKHVWEQYRLSASVAECSLLFGTLEGLFGYINQSYMTYNIHWISLARSSTMADQRRPSASLVTDVLLKSGRLEKEDINSCVKKTLQKAEEVKASVFPLFYRVRCLWLHRSKPINLIALNFNHTGRSPSSNLQGIHAWWVYRFQ